VVRPVGTATAEALAGLNPEQRVAAEHFEGPMLVLAGAGSGKTRVLTTRIAHLIGEHGVAPHHILALTFTNKAAGEMRERVRTLLDHEPAGMWIGTFHATGVRILRRYATRLGWTPGFLIYDADDALSLLRRIVKTDLGLDPKRWNPKAFRSAISAAKNELVSAEAYAEQARDAFETKVADAYGRYQKALSEANAFDFDDLLVKPVELLRRDPGVLAAYRERFPFILVDEYQDTNHAQYVFLQLLSRQSHAVDPGADPGAENLFVVGDDDQSIYGWRGADIRNILDFEQDFADARVVRLERNYRSTRTILDAANRVIEENVRRKGKTLRTEEEQGEEITLVESADEADEAGWIVGEVLSRLGADPGLTARDVTVLYRTNAQSRSLEEALRREGVPYRVVGGVRFYERREIRDVLAYLRIVANPAADEAFLRVVNVPRRGVGDTSIARLAEWATAAGVPLLAAAGEAAGIDSIRGAASRSLPEFAALIRKHAALAEREVPLEDVLRQLVEESGIVQALRDEGPEGEDRVANVEELIAGAAELQSRLDEGDPELALEIAESGEGELRAIDLFLAHVALVADIDQHDADADVVTLMTLHNAKGLEFPVVFIAGLEDGLFPLARAHDEPAELEEERRLFYVGITRAKRKLYLTHARRRRRGREWLDAIASSFLRPIPEELLEHRRTDRVRMRGDRRSGYEREGYDPFASSPPLRRRSAPPEDPTYVVDYADSQDLPNLNKGARVRHPQFGSGTVRELTGVGSDLRATIEFDSVGRKRVAVRYANLQPDWD